MRLAEEQKKLILDNGTKVYESYALMHIFKDSATGSYIIDGKKQTLQQYFSDVLDKNTNQNPINITSQINNKSYSFQLDKQSDASWKLKILGTTQDIKIKKLDEYQSDDIISLLGKYGASFSRDRDNNLLLSTEIEDSKRNKHILGGNKLDLRSIHISNIYNILQYLQNPKLAPHMLIAMATGSGKSITQAVWFLILFLGDIPAFFSAPDHTCKRQLRDEFAATLPDSITSHINSKNDRLTNHPELPKWGILTHHELLQDNFAELNNVTDQQCWIAMDEQHEAMREELNSERVKLLSKNHALMFLSATPTRAAYKLANNQSVSNLSSKDKERLGISKAPQNKSSKPDTLSKKAAKMKASFTDRLKLAFVDLLEPERTSPANEYYDMLQRECHFRQNDEKFYADIATRTFTSEQEKARFLLRWNYLTPCQKNLVLTSDHDVVVNLSLLADGNRQNVYKNGNKVPRSGVYAFFMLGEDADKKYFDQNAKNLQNFAKETVKKYLDDSKLSGHDTLVDFSAPDHYNRYNVLHGLIGNTLTFLTGYDEARLDYERFNNLEELTKLVAEKSANITIENIKEYLKKDAKLPESIINEVSSAMFEVVQSLNSQKEKRSLIVDNWSMDSELHNMFKNNLVISNFTYKYQTIFMVNGLDKSHSKIKSNKPFFRLKEKTINLHGEKGINPEAPPHKLSSLEALNDYIYQYLYEPEYCSDEMTDEVVVEMFKKGLVGSLVTSEKTTGFNDKNLHNVALLLGSNQDHLNRPDKIIQAAGRNRGLNPARQPFFMLCVDDKAVMSFDPANLDKTDVFPDFYKAKEKSYQVLMREIGVRISDKMRHWLDQNMTPKGDIDHEQFSNEALDICMEEFEKLYNENGHSFNKTRSDFKYILADLYKELARENEIIKNGHALPRAALIVAEITNAILQMIYTIASVTSYIHLKSFRYFGKLPENEQTYANIVDRFVFSELIEVGTVLVSMQKKIYTKLIGGGLNDISLVIKNEKVEELNKDFKEFIAPYLANMVEGTVHQEAILNLMLENNSWLSKLEILKKMGEIIEHSTGGASDDDIAKFTEEFTKLLKSDKKINSYMRLHDVEINVESMIQAVDSIGKAREELQKKRLSKMRSAFDMKESDNDFEQGIKKKIVEPLKELADLERKRLEKVGEEVQNDLEQAVKKNTGSFSSSVNYILGRSHKEGNQLFLDSVIPSIQKFMTEEEARAIRNVFNKDGKFVTKPEHVTILSETEKQLKRSKNLEEKKDIVTTLLLRLAPEKNKIEIYNLMQNFPYSTAYNTFNDHFHQKVFPVLYNMMDDHDKDKFAGIVNKYKDGWGKAAVLMGLNNAGLSGNSVDIVDKLLEQVITDKKDKDQAKEILEKYLDKKQAIKHGMAELFAHQIENILLVLPANYRQVIHKNLGNPVDTKSLDFVKAINVWQEKNPGSDLTLLENDRPMLFSFVINVIIEAAPDHHKEDLNNVLKPDFAKEALTKFAKFSKDQKTFEKFAKPNANGGQAQDVSAIFKICDEYIDRQKANKFIHDMSASYFFEQKLLLKELKKVFDKLEDKDLINILKVRDIQNPEEEAKKIRKFLKDMDTMKTEDFFGEYGKIPEDFDLEKVPLTSMIKNITGIYEEIVDCKCYFDSMTMKGDPFGYGFGEVKIPKLKGESKSEIWNMHSVEKFNYFVALSNKSKFLKGTIDGLKKIGAVEEIHYGKRSKHMQDAAKHLVGSLERNLHNDTLYDKIIAAIREFFHNLFKISVSAEHILMRNSAKEVAKELNAAESFSLDEISNPNNPYKNAVARTRRGWEERVAAKNVGNNGPERGN